MNLEEYNFAPGDGHQFWRLGGPLHREDGPASIYEDGTISWYLSGVRLTMLYSEII